MEQQCSGDLHPSQLRGYDASSRNSSSSSGVDSSSFGRPPPAASEGGEPGSSSVWVGVEGRGVLGVLGMRDVLRPDARHTISRLHEMGMR